MKSNRNFNFNRNEETREIDFLTVRFNLDDIYKHFIDNIHAINEQSKVIDRLNLNCDEANNIMRSQIVFLGSALDFYMHELTKFGLCQIYDGIWPTTEKYYDIKIEMRIIETPLKISISNDWFLDCINELYKTVTMISYKSIKKQISLLGLNIETIANTAFPIENSLNKMKTILNSLFERRNVIAHQFDRNHYDAQVNIISKEIVENFIYNIIKIVKSIHTHAQSMNIDK